MKKSLSNIIAIIIVIAMLPTINAHAAVSRQAPINGGWARIRYAGNGKYLDIPSESFYDNGAQLQVWDYVEGNQNQIFIFYDTGNGWQIFSHLTGKIIEVRNSSHDDYAQVAQWDKHNLNCGRWDIIANNDGTVSFKNRESGLYLNVLGGGDASNGTKIIQYHDDGTVAMKFYLELMSYGDIYSASFIRNVTNNDIEWARLDFNTTMNYNKYLKTENGLKYVPIPNQKILERVDFIPAQTVLEIIKEKAYSKSTWQEIEDTVKGEGKESAIALLLKRLGFGNVPGIGYGLGILQALLDMKANRESNNFLNAVQYGKNGLCGVIVYTYYKVEATEHFIPNANGRGGYSNFTFITGERIIEYKTWTPENYVVVNNVPSDANNGQWKFYFK